MTIKEIGANELVSMMAGQSVRIIDVREKFEVDMGTIESAEHIPLRTIPTKMSGIDKDSPVIIICRSGNRYYQACSFLMSKGYENVINLRGGVTGWARDGYGFAQLAS